MNWKQYEGKRLLEEAKVTLSECIYDLERGVNLFKDKMSEEDILMLQTIFVALNRNADILEDVLSKYL